MTDRTPSAMTSLTRTNSLPAFGSRRSTCDVTFTAVNPRWR